MRRIFIGVSVLGMGLAAAVPALLHGQGTSAQQGQLNPPIAHSSSQSITPSFEGWYINPDGSYSLSFGYMNRNYAEEPDIQIGANNRFSPGPEDRGQPTHFLPRRQWGVFAVQVPKDAARDKNFTLTWTIVANGQPVSIPGHLRPEWEIDALKEATAANTPPVISFTQGGPTGQGPLGLQDSLTVAYPGPATLTVFAKDDGIKKREQIERPSSAPPLGVGWSKYRGPGAVTFTPTADPKVEGGKASTKATFSEPGEYVLRLHAWDDSGRYAGGFQCCWTNGHVKVTVTGSKTPSR